MPIRAETRYAAICPVCGGYPDLGNDFTPLYKTRKEVHEALDKAHWQQVDEQIADSCSGSCADKYRHRNCGKRPCGYCKAKRKANAMSSKALRDSSDRKADA